MRMGVLCGVMGLALGGIVSSAWRVQVEDGAEWREIAEKQRQRRLHIEPKRGTIYDRNGTPLAVSVEVPSVSADVVEMLRGVDGDACAGGRVARRRHRASVAVLSIDPGEVYEKLQARHRFVWLKRRDHRRRGGGRARPRRSEDRRTRFAGSAIEGEGHRYYPARELAGPVLGFVAPDGQGKDGIELALDEELRGTVEDVRGLRDRSGRLIFEGGADGARARKATTSTLTIDEGIQHVAERELDAAMRTYETKGGSLAAVDPSTGEILALASVPGYNPNDYSESDVDARRDRAVTDRFEPGSVMKPFLIAGALAAGTLKPTDTIDCEHGFYQVGGITIHDTHLNDLLSPTQILAKSSNIGAAQDWPAARRAAALRDVPPVRLRRADGHSAPRRSDGRPPAPSAALVRGRDGDRQLSARASRVTTLQLAMAMSAIANGGKLLEPMLVKRIGDGHGEAGHAHGVRVRREVTPPGVAKTVAEMLTAVLEAEEGGTAVEAAIAGFRVAGKTSTAQKVDPATGKYSNEKYTAVFVGFVPVDHPRLVVAVVLDEPMLGRYGGELAGPVFRRVAEASLRYLGVAPSGPPAKLAAAKRDADPADAAPALMKPSAQPSPAQNAASTAAADPRTSSAGHRARPRRDRSARARRPVGAHQGRAGSPGRGLGPRRTAEPRGGCCRAQGDSRARGARARVMIEAVEDGARVAGLRLDELARELPGGRRDRRRRVGARSGSPPRLAGSRDGRPLRRAKGRPRRRIAVRRRKRYREGPPPSWRRAAPSTLRTLPSAARRVGSCRARSRTPPSAVYGHPSFSLEVVGITGTNGKTTTAPPRRERPWTAPSGRQHCGVLGTVGHFFGVWRAAAEHTTPEADDVARMMAEMRARGATHVAMEVSSHALALGRVHAVRFRVAAFTNLTQDHLDFHGSMDALRRGEGEALHRARRRSAVINVDDPFGDSAPRLKRQERARRPRAARGRRATDADVAARATARVDDAWHRRDRAHARRRRAHRVAARSARTTSRTCLVAWASRTRSTSTWARRRRPLARGGSPGRLERCDTPADDVIVLVDYAHTPDALARVLDARSRPCRAAQVRVRLRLRRRPRPDEARAHGPGGRPARRRRHRDERQPAHRGPGGHRRRRSSPACGRGPGRARGRARPAARHRPRGRSPRRAGDIVLIAGKGHEDYQIIGRREAPVRQSQRGSPRARATRREARGSP